MFDVHAHIVVAGVQNRQLPWVANFYEPHRPTGIHMAES